MSHTDIMKIPKLLHKKTSNPSESNDDDDDVEVERGETIGEGEGTDPGQTEASQEAGQKKADNQAILQLLGEGEKVGMFSGIDAHLTLQNMIFTHLTLQNMIFTLLTLYNMIFTL